MRDGQGIYINKIKYRMVKWLEQGSVRALYMTGANKRGCTLQLTKQCIVFGGYDKARGQNAGNCNMAVEKLSKALTDAGY